VYTGLLAQAIARRTRVLRPERLFVAGVMHDIGSLILNHRYPELAEEMIREANGDETLLYHIERRELGFEHAHLGSLMLEYWQLPASITDAINWHHEPHLARHAPVEAAIAYLAELLANASGTGSFSELPGPELQWDATPLTRLGLPVDFSADQLMDDVDPEYVETLCLFLT
jgi:HD-like signal output (HDOD) protein